MFSRDAGTSVRQGGRKKVEGEKTYEKQKKSLPVIRPVPRRGAEGLVSPEKNVALPWRNVLDIV